MPRTPAEDREEKRAYLRTAVENGEVSEADEDRIVELVKAFDESTPTVERPRWPDAPDHLTTYRKDSTLANWYYHLTRAARVQELSTATTTEVNAISEALSDGSAPTVKDDGLAGSTVKQYQQTLRMFYRYQQDLDVDRERIQVYSQNGEGGSDGFDPEDILSIDEIKAVRREARHPRDAAVFDLLLFTGMRNGALRTLRVRDVAPDDGEFRFNTDADGLKNIYQPRAKRHLLYAAGSGDDWLAKHPCPDDPDAYLITAKPEYTAAGVDSDAHTPVSDKTIARICRNLKEAAGITKPMHPHMLRHNYVYVCDRVFDLDDKTIKFNLGHAPASNIMETTYRHLSADDHFEATAAGAGLAASPDGEDVGFFLGECSVCGRDLPEQAKACPRCGTVLTPDAAAQQQELQERAEEQVPEVENEEEARIVAAVLEDLRENPDEYVE